MVTLAPHLTALDAVPDIGVGKSTGEMASGPMKLCKLALEQQCFNNIRLYHFCGPKHTSWCCNI